MILSENKMCDNWGGLGGQKVEKLRDLIYEWSLVLPNSYLLMYHNKEVGTYLNMKSC